MTIKNAKRNCKTVYYCLLKIPVTHRPTFAVYYALTAYAKVKVCMSNFPLDICHSNVEISRCWNIARLQMLPPQNFIKDTRWARSRYTAYRGIVHLVYLIRWCTRYIRKFFRKRHRQMWGAFFKTGRSVILLRDSTTNNAGPGIKVVPTDRCCIIQEKHNTVYLNTAISITNLQWSRDVRYISSFSWKLNNKKKFLVYKYLFH